MNLSRFGLPDAAPTVPMPMPDVSSMRCPWDKTGRFAERHGADGVPDGHRTSGTR
jgi:hypothetical protein